MKIKHKLKILSIVIGLLISNNLIHTENAVLKWPIPKKYYKNISSTFGESRLDHYHLGVDIPGANLPVYPVKKGKIIWKTTGNHKNNEIPFGGGKTIIIDHNGYWSGYMHLNVYSEKVKKQKIITVNDKIGTSGNSGHSGGSHLHFFIFSQEKQVMYNPLALLPKDKYQDLQKPIVKAYGIKLDTKEEIVHVNIEKSFVLSKDFPFYAKIEDSGNKKERWGIYYLKVFNSSDRVKPIFEITFNKILFKNKKWISSNNLTFDEVFNGRWYYLGKNFKSTKTIYWEAGGLDGPSNSKIISLDIRDK